jgi:glycosyltransferase involved in cell wall biosynthesis
LKGYLAASRSIRREIDAALDETDAAVLRIPSHAAYVTARRMMKRNRPFAVEVVGDPYDVFAPEAFNHPLRPLLRQWMSAEQRWLCASAAAVSYVSPIELPKRYPPSPRAFVTAYSSIELGDNAFVPYPRLFQSVPRPLTLITVASLACPYKRVDVLLHAARICIHSGFPVRVVVVGDGRCRNELEELAASLGIKDQVRFAGTVSAGDGVRSELDRADLFVLCSRPEGLPRAMIEAMARGLPCIGTNVGGIRQLLSPEEMVPCGDPDALASKLTEIGTDPRRLALLSERNLAAARAYHDRVLDPLRIRLYEQLRDRVVSSAVGTSSAADLMYIEKG